jgi:ABC-2 type transport system ATP-binding protein
MDRLEASVTEADGYAVEAAGLTRHFGDFVAVDGVSFRVQRGEIFGFLGPNGAGKTTTMRMLLGVLEPTAGTARVLGCDVATQARELRGQIGYMSQQFSLYDELSVRQNLAFFGGTYGLGPRRLPRRMREVLESLGLAGRERERANNLAGGWRQRLALGCAILHEPEILFLDEPTAGVDPVSRREFWNLLYALSDQGRTIFVTTHYMDEAEHCHRLGFIQHGRLIALGTPERIKRERMAADVVEIDCDQPARAVVVLRELGLAQEVALYGALVHAVTDDADAFCAAAHPRLAEEGIGVESMSTIAPSLEDVFISSVRATAGS